MLNEDGKNLILIKVQQIKISDYIIALNPVSLFIILQ